MRDLFWTCIAALLALAGDALGASSAEAEQKQTVVAVAIVMGILLLYAARTRLGRRGGRSARRGRIPGPSAQGAQLARRARRPRPPNVRAAGGALRTRRPRSPIFWSSVTAAVVALIVLAIVLAGLMPLQGATGPRGGTGPAGGAGAGAMGATGADGNQSLVSVTTESAGANCAAAGQKIVWGLDNGDGGGTARDGILQAGEQDGGPQYACNGAAGAAGSNGANGYNSLVDVQAESPGANCAAGGKKVYSGLDNGDGGGTANNGVLEAGERDQGPNYVCNGAAGSNGAAGRDAGLKYTYSTGTSGDPGSGKFGFNTVTLASIATLRISETDGDTNGISAFIAMWDDSTTTGARSTITILGDGAASRLLVFTITSAITDNGAYDSFSVTYVTSTGSWADSDVDKVFPQRTGDLGGTGSTGSNGFSSLMKFTAEAAGANCPSGGQKVQAGLDNGDGGGTANDGTLQAGEVDTTQYLCVPNVGGKMVYFTSMGGTTPAAATQWTNMPAALTELLGGTNLRIQTNLTGYTQVRFGVDIQVVSAANSFLLLQYSTDNSTFTNACGATCPEINVGSAGSKWTAWQTMNSTMAADVLLRVVAQNGDGAADPTFNEIYCEFR